MHDDNCQVGLISRLSGAVLITDPLRTALVCSRKTIEPCNSVPHSISKREAANFPFCQRARLVAFGHRRNVPVGCLLGVFLVK